MPDLRKFGPTLLTLGRILLASLFILGGLNKVLNYGATLTMMSSAGLPLAELLLPITIILELGGGLILAWGRVGAPKVALCLAGYTLLVNFVFHAFWSMEGAERAMQLSLFFKNLSVAGGLLFVSGALSPDHGQSR